MRIDWVLMDRSTPETVKVGDLVSADAGGLPTYRILALEGGRALVRDEQHGCDQSSPLCRFRWKVRPA